MRLPQKFFTKLSRNDDASYFYNDSAFYFCNDDTLYFCNDSATFSPTFSSSREVAMVCDFVVISFNKGLLEWKKLKQQFNNLFKLCLGRLLMPVGNERSENIMGLQRKNNFVVFSRNGSEFYSPTLCCSMKRNDKTVLFYKKQLTLTGSL